jgi:hypothetical protein
MNNSIVRWWMVRPVGRSAGSWAALFVAAALMVASGLIHIHLWDIAYRHVATLGPLFLVQAVMALVGAVVLLVLRWAVVALGCIALMLGTVVGFILADTVGIFGFTLPVVTSWAYEALVAEVLSALVLLVLVVRSGMQERSGSSTGSRSEPIGAGRRDWGVARVTISGQAPRGRSVLHPEPLNGRPKWTRYRPSVHSDAGPPSSP